MPDRVSCVRTRAPQRLAFSHNVDPALRRPDLSTAARAFARLETHATERKSRCNPAVQPPYEHVVRRRPPKVYCSPGFPLS